MTWFQTAPLPLAGLILFAALLAGLEAGYLAHHRLARRRTDGAPSLGAPDHLLSAVLGLLALLLGFTFSLALNRYEARRDLVLQEANAIGTTWLRAQLLEEPGRTEVSGLLRRYADARLHWSEDKAPVPALGPTATLQSGLWAATGTAIRTDHAQIVSRGLMEAMNQSFDLANARSVARAAHIPEEVVGMLLLYAVLSAAMLGYMMAAREQPHRTATILLLLLVTLALILILDVDRPLGGAITVSQQPMEDLRASMR